MLYTNLPTGVEGSLTSHTAGTNHRLKARTDVFLVTNLASRLRISFSRVLSMSNPPRRPRRTPKPGQQAQRRAGVEVSADELRKIYVAAAIEQREVNGDLTKERTYHVHVEPPLPFAPPCTHSERWLFCDHQRRRIAEAHCYRRPDGSIAASGLLDPKEVFHQGVRYFVRL